MDDSAALRILALQPYDGGSHRAFLSGWSSRSQHVWTVLGLPDHSWKWRMRHAPVTFAKQVARLVAEGHAWDAIFCTDMFALAEFRGLAPPGVAHLPAVVYFHENQLTYPVREERERDLHFAFTNLVTAYNADAVWFNSRFHRDDFLAAAESFIRRMPDYQPKEMINAIREKSSVQYPGIESFHGNSDPQDNSHHGPLHIVWAARWEHDKNPEDFFAALDELQSRGVDFRVSVLGESFREVPPVFAEYRAKLADRIVHWGYQESREAYASALSSADVFVSTAHHEFFGIAAVEAMAAGCFPVLPRRLAYPELVTDGEETVREEFLYDGTIEGLTQRLFDVAQQEQTVTRAVAAGLSKSFRWATRIRELDAALRRVISQSV